MSSVTEVLRTEFELLKSEIIAAYEASGREASGGWAGTLAVEASENGASITAAGYIEGRAPGKPPPSEAIAQWIVDKGIAGRMEKDISVGSLAFLIARKIGREGWKPDKDDENIIESVVTPQRIQQIIDKAALIHLQDTTALILDYLKTAIL